MRIKKILSLAVVLAMVLTVAPMFGITAGAAELTDLESKATERFSAPQGPFERQDVPTAWTGWTVDDSGEANVYVNTYDQGNTLDFGTTHSSAWAEDNNNTVGRRDTWVTVYAPEDVVKSTMGESYLIIKYKNRRTDGSPTDYYRDTTFLDANGAIIVTINQDIGTNGVDNKTTSDPEDIDNFYPDQGAEIAIVCYNNDDNSTHTADVYVGGEKKKTATVSGVIDGFGGIKHFIGAWNSKEQRMGLADLSIKTGKDEGLPTPVTITANYKAGDDTVATEKGTYTGEAGYEFPEKNYSADGSSDLYHADATTLTATDNIEMHVIPNAAAPEEPVTASNGKEYTLTGNNLIPNGDFTYGLAGWYDGTGAQAKDSIMQIQEDGKTIKINGHTNQVGDAALYRSFPIENDTTYVFTASSTTTNPYHRVSLCNELGSAVGTEGVAIYGQGAHDGHAYEDAATGTVYYAFKNTDYKYLKILYRWCNNESVVGNFGLYKAETISGDSEITSTIPETQTIIAGNAPGIRTLTVSNNGKTGTIQVDSPVLTDDVENFEVVDRLTGEKYTINSAVTVLKKTYEISDFNGNNSHADSETFPEALNGKFTIEFDVVDTGGGDDWIYLNDTKGDSGMWGNGIVAIGIGSNGIKLRTSDGKDNDQPVTEFKTNSIYRFLVNVDTDQKKYGVQVKDVNGNSIINEEDMNHAFRKQAGGINNIGVRGDMKLSNIKISYADAAPSKPVATLGWNETDKFFINLGYGELAGTKIKVESDASTDGSAPAVSEEKETADGVTLTTDATNRVYTVTAYNGEKAGEALKVSVYNLVVDAVMGDVDKIAADKLDDVRQVINDGGIYYTDEPNDEYTKQIMTKEDDIVSITDKAWGLKIGFVLNNGNIYVGSTDMTKEQSGEASEDGIYQYMKIGESSVTLSNDKTFASAAEAITLSLDSVNIEFVETLVGEIEAEGTDAAQDFIPEL